MLDDDDLLSTVWAGRCYSLRRRIFGRELNCGGITRLLRIWPCDTVPFLPYPGMSGSC